MFDRTSEGRWWDKAWSLVEGCTPCSPGCDHCWLQAMDRRFRKGGNTATFVPERLAIPLRRHKPTAWAVWSDLFHEGVRNAEIFATFAVMQDRPTHRFLVLTKRPSRLSQIAWPDNACAGVTVCNQEEADRKIPLLLRCNAKVKFLSVEPMLGPVNLHLDLHPWTEPDTLDLVICGGESGPGARPVNPIWVRNLRDQCVDAFVPFFFKQWGPKKDGRTLDGREWSQMPEREGNR